MRTLVVVPLHDATEDADAFERALRASAPTVDLWQGPIGDGFATGCRDGFRRSIDAGYDVVITMDDDGAHDPGVISTMLGRIAEGADVVIGSRYVAGGGVGERPWWATMTSRAGTAVVGSVLRLGVRDCTSRFRAYRTSSLATIGAASDKRAGWWFSIDLLRRLRRADHDVVEIPIVHRRRRGVTSDASGGSAGVGRTSVRSWWRRSP